MDQLGLCKPYTLPWKGGWRNTGVHPLTPQHLSHGYYTANYLIAGMTEQTSTDTLTTQLFSAADLQVKRFRLSTNFVLTIHSFDDEEINAPCFALVLERRPAHAST